MKKLPKDIWKHLAAECLGTFILVFVGCGSGLYVKEESKLSPVGTALCWGLTIGTLIQTLGHVSGCHMNPAVTLAMLISGKIELLKSVMYIITQCTSSTAAISALKLLTSDDYKGGFGVIKVSEDISIIQGLGIEFISTFVFILTIFAVTDDNRSDLKGSSPLAIGLCIVALALFGGQMTGTCLNPARALGPALIMGEYQDHWVYWLGPIGGGLGASIVYDYIFRGSPTEVDDKLETENIEEGQASGHKCSYQLSERL